MNGLQGKVRPERAALAGEAGLWNSISTLNPDVNSVSPAEWVKARVSFGRVVKVRTVSLRTLVFSFSLDEVELLKMDCEVCEHEVIRRDKG